MKQQSCHSDARRLDFLSAGHSWTVTFAKLSVTSISSLTVEFGLRSHPGRNIGSECEIQDEQCEIEA